MSTRVEPVSVPRAEAPLLAVEGIETFYGGIQAVKGVSLEVREGSIVTLLGANGAGKSTTLKSISGLVPPARGTVVFAGRRIDGLPSEKIVRLGISHVPEGRELFPELTVLENLKMGAYTRTDRRAVERGLERVQAHFPIRTASLYARHRFFGQRVQDTSAARPLQPAQRTPAAFDAFPPQADQERVYGTDRSPQQSFDRARSEPEVPVDPRRGGRVSPADEPQYPGRQGHPSSVPTEERSAPWELPRRGERPRDPGGADVPPLRRRRGDGRPTEARPNPAATCRAPRRSTPSCSR